MLISIYVSYFTVLVHEVISFKIPLYIYIFRNTILHDSVSVCDDVRSVAWDEQNLMLLSD